MTEATAIQMPPPQNGTSATAASAASIETPRVRDDGRVDCGVCFETYQVAKMARLTCCNQLLCIKCCCKIAQCPFDRSEPIFWFPAGKK